MQSESTEKTFNIHGSVSSFGTALHKSSYSILLYNLLSTTCHTYLVTPSTENFLFFRANETSDCFNNLSVLFIKFSLMLPGIFCILSPKNLEAIKIFSYILGSKLAQTLSSATSNLPLIELYFSYCAM